MGLEFGGSVAGDEADDEGEDDGTDDCNHDAHDEAVVSDAAEAEVGGDEAADEGSEEADDHVHDGAEAGAFHELTGDEACDDADDDPGDDSVTHDVLRSGGARCEGVRRARRVRCRWGWRDVWGLRGILEVGLSVWFVVVRAPSFPSVRQERVRMGHPNGCGRATRRWWVRS